MPRKVIAGVEVDLDDAGYFLNPAQWSPVIARDLARESGIELTDRHLLVLEFIRQRHQTGHFITLRSIVSSGLADIKDLYLLFPDAPLKTAMILSGTPKPKGCY